MEHKLKIYLGDEKWQIQLMIDGLEFLKKGPSVIQQFEKVEDTNDDMNVELKKLKRMIKTSKSSPRKFKRG